MNLRKLAGDVIVFLALVATARAGNLVLNGDFANVGNVLNTGGNELSFNGGVNSYNLSQSPGNGSIHALDLTGPRLNAAALNASTTGSVVDASQLFTPVPIEDSQW